MERHQWGAATEAVAPPSRQLAATVAPWRHAVMRPQPNANARLIAGAHRSQMLET
jgi:hypothetical protein